MKNAREKDGFDLEPVGPDRDKRLSCDKRKEKSAVLEYARVSRHTSIFRISEAKAACFEKARKTWRHKKSVICFLLSTRSHKWPFRSR